MREHSAIVTALILDRPTCLDCLATKAGLDPQRLDETLTTIRAVLLLHTGRDRCRVCGESKIVFSVERPSA